uniref:Uncharacterized protein n=1 Tax=Fagus sylvatica TaxID=28930 RepID=A0A2N9G7H3_FAGSY
MSPCFALLQFNKSISLYSFASPPLYRPIYDMCERSYPKTASWMEDKECCSWDGVECDETTGHVIGLDLGCSWLYGPIHSNSSLFFLRHLRRLNLAGNYFNYSLLPFEFGKFKSLTHLNLSYSVFSGQIPYEISQLSSLVSLDLSYNELLIETPVWKRVVDNLTQLRELLLDRTNMSSIRPNSLMNLSSYLTTLSLNECGLQGKLEDNILCLPSLQTLNLGGNLQLEGLLPSSFLNMPMLSELYLYDNQLVGPLPNSVSGLLNLTTLYLDSNFINGTLPSWLFSLPSLVRLSLNDNQLSGEIGEFKSNSLEYLDLSGYIPSSFGNLTNLEWLDLSSNKLTGEIPTQLVDLSWLEVLNLSQNQLTGHIPTGKQFNTFGNDSYTGNLGLCGYPLSRTCNNHEAKQPPLSTLQQQDNLEPNNGFGWKAVSIGYGCGAIFGMLMGYIMFKIGKPKWLVRMVKLEQHIMLRRLKNNAHRRGGRR